MGVTARLATAFALAVLIPLTAGAPGAAVQPSRVMGRAEAPLLSAGAAAADAPAVDALVALQAEVLVLVELGAFATVPPALAEVHDTYRSYVVGIDRAGLLAWLQGSDADGTEALGRLVGAGATLHDKTVTALKPLSDDAWTALAEGRTIGLPPTVYVAALDQLHNLAGAGPASGPTDTSVTFTDPTPPANASTPTTAPSPAPTMPTSTVPISTAPGDPEPVASTVPNRPGSTATVPVPAGGVAGTTPTSALAPAATGSTTAGSRPSTTRSPVTTAAAGSTTSRAVSTSTESSRTPSDKAGATESEDQDGGAGVPLGLLMALVAVLAAIGLTTWLLMASRRRGRPTDELDAVLEAGRQLASVLDLGQLHPTMLGQARSLLGADHAAYLSRGEGSEPIADTEGPARFDVTARASLDRVAETGQSWAGPLRWHGADRAPSAVLATAVTGSGLVHGVLVVRRAADRPFQRHDQARLERLAPFVAAALSAAARHQALTDLTFTDALTNLANRRQLDDHVSAAVNGAGDTIGFAMIDVDHFKAYNDTHGHPAGDALLRQLAALLAANVRPGDVVYRYGGEEFAILLPGADQVVAAEVGERVRAAIHRADLPGGATQPSGRVTVSVGIAVGPTETAESLKGQADQSLYEAKRSGRDRVVIAPARP